MATRSLSTGTLLDFAFGASQVATIYTATNQYWVILELEPRYQTDPSALASSARS